MSEAIINIFSEARGHMDHSIEHLRSELTKIRTGKASPAILDGLKVNYYGNPTQLSQVANLSTPDSKTISIQPWEKSMLAQIEQAIFAANLGLTPMNDGETIRITIPPLTEERRKDLVKVAKALGEDAKVSIRNERQKIMNTIKAEVKNGFAEDQGKKKEAEVQIIVNSYGDKIAKLIEAKEKDIMTV
jgi:ribosome recycling factor